MEMERSDCLTDLQLSFLPPPTFARDCENLQPPVSIVNTVVVLVGGALQLI
jgi:hypothetical protein